MMYFNNPTTLEELKKQYKELAMKYHPDRGGDLEIMKAVNAEYDVLFAKLKNVHAKADGTTYERETDETPNEFKHVIDILLNLDGVDVEICGSWIWLTGNTYPHREVIKSLGFSWSKQKTAWYWHEDGYRKYGKKLYTMDEIRDLYGSQTVKKNGKTERKAITA